MRNLLNRKVYKEFTMMDSLFILIVFGLGALIRLSLFRFQSNDYIYYLKVWVDKMAELGGFASLQYRLNNYTTPYTLFLTIISYIPYNTNYLIKVFSCFFDVLMAMLTTKLVYDWTKDKNKTILVFTLVFISPVVTLNSGAWAQCDVIYSFFMMLFVYFLLKEKSFLSMLFFGIAFSIKLQTIFIFPILVLALMIGKIKWRDLLEIPIIYLISMLPALIAGRPFRELASVYTSQAGLYPALTLNYPNIYYLIGAESPAAFGTAGLLVAVVVVGFILYKTLQNVYEKEDLSITNTQLIQFTLLTGAVMLYLLPHMHDRYGYFLDILIIVYAVIAPEKWYQALLWNFITLMSYVPFLIDGNPLIDFRIQAVAQGIVILMIALDYKKSFLKSAEL